MGVKVLLAATMSWPATARIAGGLNRFGCHADVLCPPEAPVRYSRYVNLRHAYSALSPITSLREALSISRPDLVIPCDDRAVLHMLSLLAQEPASRDASCIARSLGAPENYSALLSRGAFMAECGRLGIAVPQTIRLTTESELDAALDALGLPAVLKTDGSWGGEGVIIAQSRDEARAAYRKLSRPVSPLRSLARAVLRHDAHHLRAAIAKPVERRISIQKFISGSPATTAFACWQGDVMGAIHADVVVAAYATGPSSVFKRIECAEMDAAARAIARRFKLSGLHGLDFIRNAEGRAFLLEINPRATQTSYLAFGPGRDPVCGLVEGASGAYCRARPPTTANHLIALFPQEWSRNPWSPYLKAAFHDIPWDDPDLLRAWLAATPPAAARKNESMHLSAKSRVYGLETILS
jgi:ATP-grasp domain